MAKHRRTFLVALTLASAACDLSREGLGQASAIEPSAAPEEQDAAPAHDAPRDGADPQEQDDRRDAATPSSDAAHAPIVDAQVRHDASAVLTKDASAQPASGCPLAGLHALRIDADVIWNAQALTGWTSPVAPGSGRTSLFALVGVQSGTATMQACGANVPALTSISGQRFEGSFPDATWDKIDRRWTTQVTTSCDDVGCSVSAKFVEPQLGIALAPLAAWPGPYAQVDPNVLRDDDGDGVPGVLYPLITPIALPRTYAGYGGDYATAFGVDRVSDLSLALRLGLRLEGKLDSCDAASGSGSALTVDARVLACWLQDGGMCRDDQVGTLERSLPAWAVERASWRLVRLAPASSCADVRAALP
jgi:hypothetical protein